MDVARSSSAERVISVLQTRIEQHGAPQHLRSDNGAEFVATAVQTWLVEQDIQPLSIEPGKPWQNGKEERFNGTVRDECFNRHLFASLAEAIVRLNAFPNQYNTQRPHSQLDDLTPQAFKVAWVEAQVKPRDPLIGT